MFQLSFLHGSHDFHAIKNVLLNEKIQEILSLFHNLENILLLSENTEMGAVSVREFNGRYTKSKLRTDNSQWTKPRIKGTKFIAMGINFLL
jgi:hypothetical protein